ncbi:hypothetical protein [Methylovulum miyakonense]|uniref:hypothetical protein n=1 Tax=Methylovulum miyakonense TaxID=645578 RepID=UPI00039BC4FE|nr:hypothetical protein [Methylovulum miyakonense]
METQKSLAIATGVNPSTFRTRVQRTGSVESALAFSPKLTLNFPINGIDLTLDEWCHYLGVSHQAIYKTARKRNLTSLQELQRRFKEQPQLFPSHLLNPKHLRYSEVKAK